MEFDNGTYSPGYSGDPMGFRPMRDLDTLDELRGMLEAYSEIDDHKAVRLIINRIKKLMDQLVQDAIL